MLKTTESCNCHVNDNVKSVVKSDKYKDNDNPKGKEKTLNKSNDSIELKSDTYDVIDKKSVTTITIKNKCDPCRCTIDQSTGKRKKTSECKLAFKARRLVKSEKNNIGSRSANAGDFHEKIDNEEEVICIDERTKAISCNLSVFFFFFYF